MKQWTIYRHIHNESGRSYIGLTAQTMERRWATHISKAQRSKGGRWHFPNAIRKHGPQAFSHEVLQVCSTLLEANTAEQFWIWVYDTKNPLRGFNLTSGGAHTPHPVKKDHWADPEFRARQCDKIKALWKDPVWVAKNRAANKTAVSTPEYRLKMSVVSKEIHSRPGVSKKCGASFKGKHLTEKHRAAIGAAGKGRICSLETRKKISEKVKLKFQDPVIHEKMSVSNVRFQSAKTRKKKSESCKRSLHTPEIWNKFILANKEAIKRRSERIQRTESK